MKFPSTSWGQSLRRESEELGCWGLSRNRLRKAGERVERKAAQPWAWASASGYDSQSRGKRTRQEWDPTRRGPAWGLLPPVPVFPEQQLSLHQICLWLPITFSETQASYWPISFHVASATPTVLPKHLPLTLQPTHLALSSILGPLHVLCQLPFSFLQLFAWLGPSLPSDLCVVSSPLSLQTLVVSTPSCFIFLPHPYQYLTFSVGVPTNGHGCWGSCRRLSRAGGSY